MCASTESYLHSVFLWPWPCHSSSSRASFWVRIAIPALQSHCHNVSKQLNTMLRSLDLFNQFSSVFQSCTTLCHPMDCSMPGLPVHHQLLEFTQTRVHWVSDAIQPSHPLLFPFSSRLQSFPASGSFPMNQFFASGGQNIGVWASTSVLPKNIQDWFPLRWTGWISLQFKGLSRIFSNTTVQKHQFFSTQLSL